MRYLFSLVLFLLSSVFWVYGQSGERGIPFIDNFTPKEYNANTQNWAVVQDQRGVMYFGNNKGVLEYDGVSWRLIPVKNHSIVRSLAMDSAGTIFVGAVGEFGYLAPDSTGALQYNSLLPETGAEEDEFSDVWSTLTKGDEVYFQSFYVLFRYKQGKLKSWPLTNAYHRSFIVHDKLYLRDEGKGLMVMEDDILKKVAGGAFFSDQPISSMLPFGKDILIGSRSRGLFLYSPAEGVLRKFASSANNFLGKNLLYHGAILADGSYAFSTTRGGVVVIDKKGEVLVRLDQHTGLLSQTTYYLYPDKQGTLWLGLGNGISKVEIVSPIQVFDKILGLDGGILAAIRFKGVLYVCTHQGVFFLNEESHFEPVESLNAQCWQLEKFQVPSEEGEEKLLVVSTSGVFELDEEEATLIFEGRAGSLETSRSDPSRIFIGFNGYIGSLRYEKGEWIKEGTLKVVSDEFRSLKEDEDGNLWMGSMYSGVYRLEVADWEAYIRGENEDILRSIKNYGLAEGLPALNWNYFYGAGSELIVTTQEGIYRYNKAKDAFDEHTLINSAFADFKRWFYYMNEDEEGNLWFDSEKGKGVLLKEGEGYTLSENPFKRIIVSPENQVSNYIDTSGIVWFGTPDGLFRYNRHIQKEYDTPFHVLIRRVTLGQDSTLFNGTYFEDRNQAATISRKASLRQPRRLNKTLDYSQNSLSFQYAAPVFENERANQFSYKLEGYDSNWSGWTRETKKEYTNLPEGKYVFKVKAKNFYDTVSEEATYEFAVLPPWYRLPIAYVAFFFLLVGLVSLAAKAYSKRLKRDNMRLEVLVRNRTEEINQQKERIEKQKNEVEQSYRNVTTLSRLGQDVTATLEFKAIIQNLFSGINTLMDVSSFGVGIFNAQSQSLDFRCAYEEGQELPPFSLDLSKVENLAAWCFSNKKEVFIKSFREEFSLYLSAFPAKPPTGDRFSESVIYIPLQIKGKRIGVITVQSFEKGAYQPYHLDILRSLAAYTAIALDNSYAYLRVSEINEELKTTLENLKHTQTQLVQSEKMASLGQLTAGVAHEINNPINFVSAGIDSLTANYNDLQELLTKLSALKAGQDNTALLGEIEALKKKAELDYLLQEIPQLLQSIKTGAQRTTEIVKSLKNFTRLDEDSLKMADLQEGLDSTLVILRNQLNKNIQVVKEYDEQLPLIQCYPGQLNQVFMNILNNAIQAVEGEGEIRISTARQGEQVLIRIKDSGRGMSAEVKSRIFEPFFTTKEVGEGTGLGLSISYSIIEKHKGKIEVESTPGKGTEFIICLPVNLN